jgi:hypothetical protein
MSNLGETYGKDKHGHPITWNFYGVMDDSIYATDENVNRFIRWRIQLMERAIAKLDFNGPEALTYITQIHDYEGASMRPKGRMREATKKIIALFSSNYPEFLSQKLFVNVPPVMEALFGMISFFSSAKTRSKFRMIGSTATRLALLDIIPLSDIPTKFTGSPFPDSPAYETLTIPARGQKIVWREAVKGNSLTVHFFTTSLDIGYCYGFLREKPAGAQGEISDYVSQVEGDVARVEEAVSAYTPVEDGFVWFLFDNSYSYFTAKSVLYTFKG